MSPAGLQCVKCRGAVAACGPSCFGECDRCGATYPVVANIPVMVSDLPRYLMRRYSVGLQMMRLCGGTVRDYISECMPANGDDCRGSAERRWAAIYMSNGDSRLYDEVAGRLSGLPGESVLELGCSVGALAGRMGGTAMTCVDISFPALVHAARQYPHARYVLADVGDGVFGAHGTYDTVVALNVLDIVEPSVLLKTMARCARRHIVLADPYDYQRGPDTVGGQMSALEVRRYVERLGFGVTDDTKKPSYVPWTIRINARTAVRYLVDVIVAERL